jgi:hypothetical protein
MLKQTVVNSEDVRLDNGEKLMRMLFTPYKGVVTFHFSHAASPEENCARENIGYA